MSHVYRDLNHSFHDGTPYDQIWLVFLGDLVDARLVKRGGLLKRVSNGRICGEEVNIDHRRSGRNLQPENVTRDSYQSSSAVVSRSFGSLKVLKQSLIAHACAENSADIHQRYGGRLWTVAISAFADSAYALDSAPLACYTSCLGRSDHNPSLVQLSRRLYIQGLSEVQNAINQPSTALRDETFGACFALIIYEAMECPDQSQKAYDVHIDGCSKLVKLRGARMHEEGASHYLFRAFRLVDILRAFETHRPSYLASRAWTTLPWQNHPKANWDVLLDLLAEGPAVLQKGDKLESMPRQRFVPAVMELIEELLALEHRMQAYYTDLSASCQGQLFWEMPPAIFALDELKNMTSSQELTPGPDLQFYDTETARILTLYWASLSILWSGIDDLWGAVQALVSNGLLGKFQQIQGSLIVETRDWLDPIRKVCRSARYCQSDLAQGMGYVVLAAPLDVVLGVMKNRAGCSTEYAEAKKIRRVISQNWLRLLQYTNQEV